MLIDAERKRGWRERGKQVEGRKEKSEKEQVKKLKTLQPRETLAVMQPMKTSQGIPFNK